MCSLWSKVIGIQYESLMLHRSHKWCIRSNIELLIKVGRVTCMPRMRSYPKCRPPDPEESRLRLRESVVILGKLCMYLWGSSTPLMTLCMWEIKRQWPATYNANIETREISMSTIWGGRVIPLRISKIRPSSVLSRYSGIPLIIVEGINPCVVCWSSWL